MNERPQYKYILYYELARNIDSAFGVWKGIETNCHTQQHIMKR